MPLLDLLRVRDPEGRDRAERAPWDPPALAPDLGRVLRRLLPVVVRPRISRIH